MQSVCVLAVYTVCMLVLLLFWPVCAFVVIVPNEYIYIYMYSDTVECNYLIISAIEIYDNILLKYS